MEQNTFQAYKSKRKNVDSLISKIKDANEKKKKDYSDKRIYKYQKDKTGNALSVCRFLPSKNDLPPVISTFSHSFQYRGKWFIENCATSIKQQCPVCTDNSKFFAGSCTEAENTIGRQRSRRKEYYSNIFVVKDTQNPEAEGKVFIWKFGQKVYEKIMAQLQPEFDGEKPVDIFDLFEGKNFKLKIKTVGGYSNYDGCEFLESAPLFVDAKGKADEGKIEEVYNQLYDLSEFIAPTRFKTYEQVKAKFESVVGTGNLTETLEDKVDAETADEKVETTKGTKATEETEAPEEDEVTDEETDSFFEELDK